MTLPDDRGLLFLRLRAATGGSPPARDSGAGGSAPAAPPEDGRVERFGDALTSAGGLLFAGPVESTLHELAETLRAAGVTVLVSPEGDAASRMVAEALVPFGPFALSPTTDAGGGEGDPPAANACFRTAEAGIAETGTVVETSAGGRKLSPGLSSDVQVYLLPAASLFERLEDALASLGRDLPRGVFLRTGPARTTDIEQTFVPGIFGPRKAIVLILD